MPPSDEDFFNQHIKPMLGDDVDYDDGVDHDDGVSDTEGDETAQGTAAPSEDGAQGTSTAQQEAKPDDAATEASATEDASKQQQADDTDGGRPEIIRDRNGWLVDKKGNIYNEQGQVIIKAGNERNIAAKFYRQATTEQRRAERLEQELQQLRQSNESALNGLPQQYGLNATQTTGAIQLAHQYQKDPVGVIKSLLADAMQAGHDVRSILGQPGQGGMSPDIIATMVNNAVKPITERFTQEDQQRQTEAQAQRQQQEAHDQFVRTYPDAPVHTQELVTLVKQHGYTPEQAYHQLELYAARHGLDMSMPLGPQVDAKQQQQQPTPAPAQQQPARPTQPVGINGARATSVTPTDTRPNVQQLLAGDYRSIIDSVLDQHNVH